MQISHKELLAAVRYDQDTGHFYKGDSRAEHSGGQGYLNLTVSGVEARAHRYAWLYVYGVWPKGEIDHVNGSRADNRITNLRDVPRSINQQNRHKPQKNNKSGFLGVSLERGGKKYRATVRVGKKGHYIGSFDTAEAAHDAYVQAKRQLHLGCTL